MKKILAICLVICILVVGCGTGDKAGEKGDVSGSNAFTESAGTLSGIQEKNWVMNDIAMPDGDAALSDIMPENGTCNELLLDVAGDSVYRMVSLHTLADGAATVEYCVQKLSPPYEAWENIKLANDNWGAAEVLYPTECALKPYIEEDGSIHMILKGAETYYVCEWNESEGCKSRALPENTQIEEIEEYWVTSFPWRENDGEEVYVGTWQGLMLYDKDLAAQIPSNCTPEGVVFQIIRNPFTGELLFAGATAETVEATEESWRVSDGGFSIWGTESKEPLYVAENNEKTAIHEMGCFMDYDACVVWASATEGFLCTGQGIWWFSTGEEPGEEDDARAMIYDYAVNGLNYTNPSYPTAVSASFRKDGALLMLTHTTNNGVMLRELVTGEKESGKQVVQVAITGVSTSFERAVVEFNNQSEEYKVVLRRPGTGEDWDDYRNRIQAELSSGDGPALIEETVLDMGDCAKHGYIMDLTEEFAEYEEQLMPAVWLAGQVDGRLYGLPFSYNVNTLIANKDVVGDRTGWTLDEAMEITRESGANAFMHDVTPMTEASLFWNMGLLMGTGEKLVDWENMTCNLNGAEAAKLLAFVKQYTGKEDPGKNEFERIYDGELMTRVWYMSSPMEIQAVSALLKNKEVYIGYPTDDGGSGHLLACSSYMVNQSSPAKEGAIAFLKYILSEDIQNQRVEDFAASECTFLDGFPVRADSMEKVYDAMLEKAAEEKTAEEEEWEAYTGWGSFNGIEYETEPITEEQIKVLRTVLETARPYNELSGELVPIFEDEFPAYISGSKSAQEVLDVVQNRAQLYINELQ